MLINWFFSKTFKQRCPDGTIRHIHKNIDKAMPLALKDMQTKFDADLSTQKKSLGLLNVEYADKISGLLYAINEQNQSLMMGFRLAYIAYQSDPCNNNEYLIHQAEELNLGQQKLMELKTQISGLISLAAVYPNDSEKILALYQKIISKIDDEYMLATKSAINDNRQNIAYWIKGKKDE